MRLLVGAEQWLWAPAPARRLAVFRILVGLFAVVYLAIRLPAFLATARLDSGFEPVGVLWFLDSPLPSEAVTALVWATLVLAVAFTVGLGWRVTGPAFALGLLVVATYRSSWGRLLYFDNLLVLHALIIAPTRAADALALTPGRRRRSTTETGTDTGTGTGTGTGTDIGTGMDTRYGWPLRLCAVITVITYVLAGVAKLRIGGPGWIDGESLRNHIAYSAARLEVLGGDPSPLASVLVNHPWLFTPMAVATMVLEIGAPAALWRRFRTVWVAGLWAMHAAIAASMLVLFPYPLFLVAFAPLYHLERLPTRLRPARPAQGRSIDPMGGPRVG